MSDLSLALFLAEQCQPQVDEHLQRGLSAWRAREPVSLEGWARQHFYLSAESSYVEQRWTPWPFQRGIMAVIGSDDVREVDVLKSARVGYTKILLADIGYAAHHLRRNQITWQPTDDDAVEFVKSEIDPMLRDVPVLQEVFPAYLSRHRDNTLTLKKFLGSLCYVKGGTAAKNYRRLSVDRARLDELSGFDEDIEKEGDAATLAFKRVEGATFPKLICGSTPKLLGQCQISKRATLADARLRFQIPCPHCGEYHPLEWGGPDEPTGFKFRRDSAGNLEPGSTRHLCPHCAALMSQADYLAVWERGRWQTDDGALILTVDAEGWPRFHDAAGAQVPPPAHIAFVDLWTAYSPAAEWDAIVRDYLGAVAALETGDDSKLKTWTNTTRGRPWAGEIERTDADELRARAEPFRLRHVPRDCLLLLCGADTQGNRVEAQVWGLGPGGEMWTIDHRVFFGNPEQDELWTELAEFLVGETYPHANGGQMGIYATAIDSGGHSTNAVYAFAESMARHRVYAIKGSSSGNEPGIEAGNRKIQYDWRGRRNRTGVTLWHVGTNLAKDRFAARLEVTKPGPGYVHLSADNSDEWFRQLAAEDRVSVRTAHGTRTRWTPNRKRNEVIDMTAYVIWLEERLGLWSPKKKAFWKELQTRFNPECDDLFTGQPEPARPAAPPAPPAARRPAPAPARSTPLARPEWSSRL